MEESITWEGRKWLKKEYNYLESYIGTDSLDKKFKIRVLSYHVFANYKCSMIRYTTTKDWDYRLSVMIEEIKNYDADIVCLQDVDQFDDWRARLMSLGYDSVYKQRTHRRDTYYEGVAIAYKRDLFQLFKTVPIELNDSAELGQYKGSVFMERCRSDDVGLLTFLQPWKKGVLSSAICVGSVMFSEKEGDSEVRFTQSQHFCRQIEIANKDFQAPVVIGTSLHDNPRSSAYHMLRTGRIPLTAAAPKKCSMPVGSSICRGSVRLKWYPPPMTAADPSIHTYRVSWRPGGSLTLGFRAEKDFNYSDCVQYEERLGDDGDYRFFVLEELACNITGLTSEVPYEFRICAINSIGQGQWSDVSVPVVLPNPENAPAMPPLEYMMPLPAVIELRERLIMDVENYNVNGALSEDPIHAVTNLTPRTAAGKKEKELPRCSVLPPNTNPREGWAERLDGTQAKSLQTILGKEFIIRRSLMRNLDGFSELVSDTAEGKLAYMKDENFHKPKTAKSTDADSITTDLTTNIGSDNSHDHVAEGGDIDDNGSIASQGTHNTQQSTSTVNFKRNFKLALQDRGTVPGREISNNWDDDVIMDCKDVVRHLGKPNVRQSHDLGLRSAYESYGAAGEPLFTRVQPADPGHVLVDCHDYIMYTGHSFIVSDVLSMPLANQFCGENPIETRFIGDMYGSHSLLGWSDIYNNHSQVLTSAMSHIRSKDDRGNIVDPFDDKNTGRGPIPQGIVKSVKKQLSEALSKSNEAGSLFDTFSTKNNLVTKTSAAINGPMFWGGKSGHNPTRNSYRSHRWLPNDRFGSSHVAIGVDLCFLDSNLNVEWK